MRYDREFYRDRLEFELANFIRTASISDRPLYSSQADYYREIVRFKNYQKMHHEICKWMFDEAENAKEIWIRIDEQDNVITRENLDSDSTGEERPYYRVTILTQTMLDYDRMMLNLIAEENLDDDSGENGYATNMYKPFFFNFLIDIKDNPHSVRFLTNPENTNQWFYGKFSESKDGFSGYIERIASPAENKEGIIEISDKRLPPSVIQNINEVYDLGQKPCSSDAAIHMELVRILEKPEFSTARIYNIGNGNCIYLMGRNSFGELKILYDIGYYHRAVPPKNIPSKIYQPSINEIRSLRPHCVIISHWDSDHYYGCAYADPAVFQCKWIAPDLGDNENVSAKRVARYLQVMKKIILADRSFGRQIANIKGFHSVLNVYIGEKKRGKDTGITSQNKEGIILEHVNGYQGFTHTLMAGDVPYESIPSIANFSTYTPYDYLVVPHHGANMDTTLLSNSAHGKGYAIICATPERDIEPHKSALTGNGYSVEVTGDARLCFDIDLMNKRAPIKR